MNEELREETRVIARDYSEAFAAIEHRIVLTRGFLLLPIEVVGPDLGRALAEWLTHKGHPTKVIEPTSNEEWETIARTLSAMGVEPNGAVMVLANRNAGDSARRGIVGVNWSRDGIIRKLGRPLLWCGPYSFLNLTAETAPDFWSVRAVEQRLLPNANPKANNNANANPNPGAIHAPVPPPPPPVGRVASALSKEGAGEDALSQRDAEVERETLDLFEAESPLHPLNAARLVRPVIKKWIEQKEFAKAAALIDKALLPICEIEGPERIDLWLQKAEVLAKESDWNGSREWASRALSDVKTRPQQRTQALLLLGTFHEDGGDRQAANVAYQKAFETATTSQDEEGEEIALLRIARLSVERDVDNEKAVVQLEKVIERSRALGFSEVEAEAREALSTAYAANRDNMSAEEALQPQIRLLDSRQNFWAHPNAERIFELLMDAYCEPEEAFFLARRVGIDLGSLRRNANTLSVWRQVLDLAVQQGRLSVLFAKVLSDRNVAGFHERLRQLITS